MKVKSFWRHFVSSREMYSTVVLVAVAVFLDFETDLETCSRNDRMNYLELERVYLFGKEELC